jgi:hypothetical protein
MAPSRRKRKRRWSTISPDDALLEGVHERVRAQLELAVGL